MEDFKIRLLDEYKELDSRKEKLRKFIYENPKFDELETKMKYVMKKQFEYMTGYSECLIERIRVLIGWNEIEAYKEGLDKRNERN